MEDSNGGTQAAIVDARVAVNRLVAAAETLAAVGMALAHRAGDLEIPEQFGARVAHIAREVVGDLAVLDAQQARALGAVARSMLAQAAAFAAQPAQPAGWAVTDPLVLQSLGQASAALAHAIAQTIVPQYPHLAERLQQPTARILDVGTGVGALSLAFAQCYPSASVVGIDVWEPALELARANVERARSTSVVVERVDVVDFESAEGFDLVWFAGPFISASVVPAALDRIFAATRPGGVVVYGTFSGADPVQQALADLRILRSGGPAWNDDEIANALARAGFVDVRKGATNIGLPARFVAAAREA